MTNAPNPVTDSRRPFRVVLSTTALVSFMSVSKATALVLAELGVAVFFVVGSARSFFGESAPWFVLGACLLGFLVRAIDIESWAFFIPGGLIGRSERAFGPRAASFATAAMLSERLLLVVLACVLCGHYAVSFGIAWISRWSLTARLSVQELVTAGAVLMIGILWTRTRLGLPLPSRAMAKGIWGGILVILALSITGIVAMLRHGSAIVAPAMAPVSEGSYFQQGLHWLIALALVLPVLGGGGALARAAREFAPPRFKPVRRTAFFVALFVLILAVSTSFLFVAAVPKDQAAVWAAIPVSALAQFLPVPAWLSGLLTILVFGAAIFLLAPAASAALEDSEQILRRLSAETFFPGDMARAGSVAALAAGLITIASGAQVSWLGRAYGITIATALLLRIVVNLRLHKIHHEPQPFRMPALAAGLVGFVVGLSALALVWNRDVPSIASLALIVSLGIVLAAQRKSAGSPARPEDSAFDLSASGDLSLEHVEASPGNIIVAVRHPDSLTHLVEAMKAAGDRDVVVLAVRVLGTDVDDDTGEGSTPTRDEQYLFSQVVALTERYARPVRLLIVPSQNVFDGVIRVALRLHSSEVYVGESSTLPASEQARLLGEAWERAEKEDDQKLRLVICHHSGRTDAYHLGAHPPSLSPGDVERIHHLWRDASSAIGPHVHHHDIVRAALTYMEQKLSGTERDEALGLIRQIARPADELASAVHSGDYSRLRDLLRNRHASDVAQILTDLGVEDQVIVFRIMPRKDAAAVFEYLSLEEQEALLKTMAHEDVATLLNSMAPDDRTMFLEELPASATRQLLAMLTPAERSIASKLLGYPENSIGRLMTPNYIGVREHWSIKEVLDYIRTHGQDSETLNVVYVVDETGMLVDDIRIREFLLAPLDKHVSDLMDRRFVGLKATDDQKAAISMFRQYDRTALPVTDTAGILIGIVTIDDVLDVAEEAATKEIQKIGGTEALDEPYMKIAMSRMIRKRAGWLTALFIGEMLTATAMGVFESEIAKVVQLALFIPLIISSGGNSGSQAATLVIRALALGEVGLADWWRIVRREIVAGAALGAILGVIGFTRITIWNALLPDAYGAIWFLLAVTVALTLVGIVLWGSLVGSILPLVLQRLGYDPAASSAPFVATLVDVTGLIIYFTVALIVFGGKMA
jgi:magnesium transporter